ncbi:MAG: hypothetical protein Q4E88_00015 [Coriobacteriia bacterium]|nr:hypothetical protein [Coriobacteriia bacterium]
MKIEKEELWNGDFIKYISFFHKSIKDWLCTRERSEEFFINTNDIKKRFISFCNKIVSNSSDNFSNIPNAVKRDIKYEYTNILRLNNEYDVLYDYIKNDINNFLKWDEINKFPEDYNTNELIELIYDITTKSYKNFVKEFSEIHDFYKCTLHLSYPHKNTKLNELLIRLFNDNDFINDLCPSFFYSNIYFNIDNYFEITKLFSAIQNVFTKFYDNKYRKNGFNYKELAKFHILFIYSIPEIYYRDTVSHKYEKYNEKSSTPYYASNIHIHIIYLRNIIYELKDAIQYIDINEFPEFPYLNKRYNTDIIENIIKEKYLRYYKEYDDPYFNDKDIITLIKNGGCLQKAINNVDKLFNNKALEKPHINSKFTPLTPKEILNHYNNLLKEINKSSIISQHYFSSKDISDSKKILDNKIEKYISKYRAENKDYNSIKENFYREGPLW